MKRKLLIAGVAMLVLLVSTMVPVAAQTTTVNKTVNTIYIWTDGPMSPQLQLTARLLSFQYNVQVKAYAGNNAARFMYGVMHAPAITVVYSNGDVSHPIVAFTTYNLSYWNVQLLIFKHNWM